MKKKRDEVLVGLLLLVTVTVGIMGSIWLARGGLEKGYPLYARFNWGAGLKQGQPVWLSGVSIGYVSNIDLLQDGSLVTELRILKKFLVPKGSTATVVPNGLFGDMAIALKPTTPTPAKFAAGDTVPTGPTAPGLAELTGKADSVAGQINSITRELETQMVAGGGFADMRESLRQMSRLMVQLSRTISEQSTQLSATMVSVRKGTSAIDSAVIDSTMRNFRAASSNLVGVTNNLVAVTESTKGTVQRMDALIAKLDTGKGTIPRLLNDSSLYFEIRRSNAQVTAALDSLTALIADIKRNPRKYIKISFF
jgi:phospholipid/cholesterol/gamma-HCH transport system substrate-binding protein